MDFRDAEPGAERPADFQNSVVRWNTELLAAERETENWRADARRISDRYALDNHLLNPVVDGSVVPRRQFNILHSNIQTMMPAVFGRVPRPIVARRHRDRDPVGRIAAQILERALETELDVDPFGNSMHRVALDLLLCGRGVPWVRFEPVFDAEDHFVDATSPVDYVMWSDFLHTPKTTWDEVRRDGWVARQVTMTRDQGLRRFGEVFAEVPLVEQDDPRERSHDSREIMPEVIARASVWEIWDAATRTVIWINRSYPDSVLDERSDPLGIDGFFPCPMPAFGSMPNNRLVPVPDYLQYEALANALDRQTRQIAELTQALRAVGIYDSSMDGIGELLSNTGQYRNQMIPVRNWQRLEGQGIEHVLSWLPLRPIVEALVGLYDARDRTKDVIYEVSGLSDIMRGQVDPREKLGQSRLKGQFASQRLQAKVQVMEQCARDTLRIKAEIMAEHYDPQFLRHLSGFDFMTEVLEIHENAFTQASEANMQAQQQAQQGMPPLQVQDPETAARMAVEQAFEQAIALLRNERMRGFRLDIETNSTMLVDDDEEKKSRSEFIEGMGAFLENALPMVQNVPAIMPLVGQLMQFSTRAFRAGREMEGAFERAIEALQQQADFMMQQQTQQGDPAQAEMQAAQMKAQAEAQSTQMKTQADMQKMQIDAQVKMAEAQARMREIQAKAEAEIQKMHIEERLTEAEIRTKIMENDLERERLNYQLQADRQRALLAIGQPSGEAR